MSYRRDLKLLRRTRRQLKRQLRQLAAFELAGLTALTLHTHTLHLTVVLVCPTGAPFTDTLREILRARLQALRTETQLVRQAWLEELSVIPPPAAAP